jgi:predicted TIM-barrel enzyme
MVLRCSYDHRNQLGYSCEDVQLKKSAGALVAGQLWHKDQAEHKDLNDAAEEAVEKWNVAAFVVVGQRAGEAEEVAMNVQRIDSFGAASVEEVVGFVMLAEAWTRHWPHAGAALAEGCLVRRR